MHKLTFEKLDSEFPVYRAPVPGGWFVVCVSAGKMMPIAMASGGTFVPDPMHSWDGSNYTSNLEASELDSESKEPTVMVFNTKTAIDFAIESGAKYRTRGHAFNSLRKLKRELFSTGIDTQNPSVLAERWYNYVIEVKGGQVKTKYNPDSFTKEVAVL